MQEIHHECTHALVELLRAISVRKYDSAMDHFDTFANNVGHGEEVELFDEGGNQSEAWSQITALCKDWKEG